MILIVLVHTHASPGSEPTQVHTECGFIRNRKSTQKHRVCYCHQ